MAAMQRLLAELLRHRTAWQLVLIAALTSSAGILIVYNTYQSTRQRLGWLLVLLFATAGAALLMAVVRRAEEVAREGQALKLWLRLAFGVFGLAGAIAFVTYSFGHHRRDMVAGCNASLLPDTLPARQAALAAAEARLRSPFAWLPALRSDEAARECARSRLDLARVDRGVCTRWPLVDRTCACGDERYPYARCPEPRCLYDEGVPDRFDCPGDPVPEGYPSF